MRTQLCCNTTLEINLRRGFLGGLPHVPSESLSSTVHWVYIFSYIFQFWLMFLCSFNCGTELNYDSTKPTLVTCTLNTLQQHTLCLCRPINMQNRGFVSFTGSHSTRCVWMSFKQYAKHSLHLKWVRASLRDGHDCVLIRSSASLAHFCFYVF